MIRASLLAWVAVTMGLAAPDPRGARADPARTAPAGTLFLITGRAPVPRPPAAGDDDRDGLLDAWEREHFGSADGDGNADPDGDGLANTGEHARGCDPWDADSDRDGVTDGRDGTQVSAADADGDGLPDDWERAGFGHNRGSAGDDPDGDGRDNRAEHAAGTDPTRPDTPDAADLLGLTVHRPAEEAR